MVDYRREIDGLRAIAVLPVILFHAGFQWFGGGYVGVDIFFVISGFLITRIIIEDIQRDRFSLVGFYERRARRILPALFFVMFVCLPFVWMWLLPSDIRDFSQSLIAVPLFSSNILFWKQSGYFAAAAELKPLLHTWSLAVEEQYYVIFPIFLLLAWKLGVRWILAILAIVFFASLGAAQAWSGRSSAFYLLPTRGWELLLGVFIAFYLTYNKKLNDLYSNIGAGVGFALIAYSIFIFDEHTPFPSLYTLVPTVGAALIILCASKETLIGRLLGSRFFVGIGLISYSAYLWHQPLFSLVRHKIGDPSRLLLSGLVILSLVLAYLSWRFVEAPFRDRSRFNVRWIFSLSVAGGVFFVILGLAGTVYYESYKEYWLSQQDVSRRNAFIVMDESWRKNESRHGECIIKVSRFSASVKTRISACYEKYGSGFIVLGDSHAADLFELILKASDDAFIVRVTQGGCRPHTPKPLCHYDEFLDYIKDNKTYFRRVVYEQSGAYLLRSNAQRGDRKMISSVPMGQEIAGVFVDKEYTDIVYQYLRKIDSYVNVTWLGARLEPHIPDRYILDKGCGFDYQLRPNQARLFDDLDAYIQSAIEPNRDVQFVSQNKMLAFQFPQDFMNCKIKYWIDGDHLGAHGLSFFSKRIDIPALVGDQRPMEK